MSCEFIELKKGWGPVAPAEFLAHVDLMYWCSHCSAKSKALYILTCRISDLCVLLLDLAQNLCGRALGTVLGKALDERLLVRQLPLQVKAVALKLVVLLLNLF
jgi:hypothetical protein